MIILEGRKIPREYENPIDDKLLLLCDKLVDICIKYNISPNQITLIRFYFLLILSFYLFTGNNYIIPIVFSFLFYLFDCLDGHLARKTNNITILGDIIDHSVDCLFLMVTVLFIYKNGYYNLLGIVVILTYFTFVHLSIQQQNNKLLKPEESCDELLDVFNYIHPFNHTHIELSKYFGSGTLMFIIFIIFYYIQINKS